MKMFWDAVVEAVFGPKDPYAVAARRAEREARRQRMGLGRGDTYTGEEKMTESQRKAARDYMEEVTEEAVKRQMGLATAVSLRDEPYQKPCTCPPGEAPVPCQHRYALRDCRVAASIERYEEARQADGRCGGGELPPSSKWPPKPGEEHPLGSGVPEETSFVARKADPDANRNTTKLAGRFDEASNKLYSLVPCARCRAKGGTGRPELVATGSRQGWRVKCFSCGTTTLPYPERREAAEHWERMNARFKPELTAGPGHTPNRIALLRGGAYVGGLYVVEGADRQEVMDAINRKG
jgi:hypothetical protein